MDCLEGVPVQGQVDGRGCELEVGSYTIRFVRSGGIKEECQRDPIKVHDL